MRVVKLPIELPDLPNNTPPYLSRPVPPHTFPLHILSSIIGGRGTGKTSFALRLVKLYDKYKSFDRIILFSTTAHKEEKMKDFLASKTFAEISHYKGYKPQDFQEEINRMEGDIEAYNQYKVRLEVWNKYVRLGYDIDRMEFDEISMLYEMDFEKPKPPTKSGLYPTHLVIFDDLLGKKVFDVNMKGVANNFLISHRHYSASVMILSQSFTSFIPKPIRNNNIGLWILFGTKCEKTMKDIADDVASKVSPDEFIKAWKYATKKPFTPLVCDYDTIDDDRRFRIGIDKLLILSNEGMYAEKIQK